MRILQVVTDTDRRGAQVFATDLDPVLSAAGATVRTVALTAGVTGGLGVPTLGPTRRHPRTIRALRSLMRGADVTVAHGSTTLPVSVIAGALLSTPVVYRQISDSRFWAPDPRRRWQTRAAMAAVDHVVALYDGAATTLTDFLDVPPRKITVVANGVPTTGFEPPTRRQVEEARAAIGVTASTVAVYVGALVVEKGVDRAVTAVAGLDDVQLVVAGDGPDRARLEQTARASGANVTFLGSVDDTGPVYRAADVLLMPSRGGDSMPAVLIEAGLCGLSSVTTDVAGIPTIVEDGVTGVVTPAHDDEAYVRAAAAMLTADAAVDRRVMGKHARERCLDRFTIDVVARGWLEVLRSVTDIAPGSSGTDAPADAGSTDR